MPATNEPGEQAINERGPSKQRWLIVVLSVVGFGIAAWITVLALDDFLWPLPPGWGSARVSLGEAELFVIQRKESDGEEQVTCECQVLLVPPEQGNGTVVGRGTSGGAESRGWETPPLLNYEVRWRVKLNDEKEQVTKVALQYDPADRLLTLDGSTLNLNKGNLFCVLLDDTWKLKNTIQLNESKSDQATLADFKRLLPEVSAVQALAK